MLAKCTDETDKKNAYYQPVLPETERFFAKRVRNWVLHLENNPELTAEIRNGKHPGLEKLLEEGDDLRKVCRAFR